MKYEFSIRQIGILIGVFIAHLLLDNNIQDCVISVLVTNYLYSIFFDIINSKQKT